MSANSVAAPIDGVPIDGVPIDVVPVDVVPSSTSTTLESPGDPGSSAVVAGAFSPVGESTCSTGVCAGTGATDGATVSGVATASVVASAAASVVASAAAAVSSARHPPMRRMWLAPCRSRLPNSARWRWARSFRYGRRPSSAQSPWELSAGESRGCGIRRRGGVGRRSGRRSGRRCRVGRGGGVRRLRRRALCRG